jgi:hypothetical protein
MNLLLWVIIGGILGWGASIIMHTNAQQGIVLNIIFMPLRVWSWSLRVCSGHAWC